MDNEFSVNKLYDMKIMMDKCTSLTINYQIYTKKVNTMMKNTMCFEHRDTLASPGPGVETDQTRQS